MDSDCLTLSGCNDVGIPGTERKLYFVNRSGNATSSQSAAAYLDRAIALCRSAGFRQILLRGDTDFSQTEHLDRWDETAARKSSQHRTTRLFWD